MMRSRDGDRRPCSYCGAPTSFQLEITGPRSGRHLRWVDCCTDCGEQEARRDRELLQRREQEAVPA
jgi:hypothetical protein